MQYLPAQGDCDFVARLILQVQEIAIQADGTQQIVGREKAHKKWVLVLDFATC
jgi:hypothetical protein